MNSGVLLKYCPICHKIEEVHRGHIPNCVKTIEAVCCECGGNSVITGFYDTRGNEIEIPAG